MKVAVVGVQDTVRHFARYCDGEPVDNSGLYLFQAMVDRWPGLQVVGPENQVFKDFEIVKKHKVDIANTLIVSMDWSRIGSNYLMMRPTPRFVPKMVNFCWEHVSDYTAGPDIGLVGYGAVNFPTFVNSKKSATDLMVAARKTQAPALVRKARIEYANLGVEIDKIPTERVLNPVPVVWFPSIWMSDRKDPGMWMRVIDRVEYQYSLIGRVRTAEIDRPAADLMVARPYVDIDVLPSRAEYYASLASIDVALATSKDESYGLAFVEAMAAGVVTILPNRPWAMALVPDGYPLTFNTETEAVGMLGWVLDDLDRARRAMEDSGVTREFVHKQHDSTKFWDAFEAQCLEWYPRLAV